MRPTSPNSISSSSGPTIYLPDQLDVTLIRRTSIGETIPLDYDSLAANPDYVVIGPFGANFNLYDEILQRGKIRLIHREGPHAVYVPVRATDRDAP